MSSIFYRHKKIDFPTGFEKDARRLIFCRDDFENNCDSNAELIIAYDPLFATDKNHFTLIKAHRNNVFPLVMPFCGHGVSESLYNAGLIPHALISLLTSGKNAIGEIRKTFRANRNSVYRYKCLRLSLICQRAASRGEIKKATQYSRELIRLKPEFSTYRTYCEIAEKYLSAEEASSRWLESITRLGNSAPAYAYVRAIIFLRKCDDIHAAERICTEGLARHPDDFGLKREQINISLKTNTNKVKGMIYEFKSKFEERAIPYLKSISNLIDINDVDLN